jgi:hypothetical protein
MRKRVGAAATAVAVLALLTSFMALGGVALAQGPGVALTGTYTYDVAAPGNTRSVTVDAHGPDPVTGTWTWTNMVSGMSLSGSVTCLVVDGQDAWMAGPITATEMSAFFWVHDGGLPGGAGDMAVTWISDPAETLADMVALCVGRSTTLTQLFPVMSGNLIVSTQLAPPAVPPPTPVCTYPACPTPTPVATPAPVAPTVAPTQVPTPAPTGDVAGETGVPAVTLPPTDTPSDGLLAPSGDAMGLIVLFSVGVVAAAALLAAVRPIRRSRPGR